MNNTVDYVRESYKDSMLMLFEGALLAIIVVWLFLRDWRATFVSSIALPLSVLPTFWVLHYVFGYTLNVMTMLALSLVVGILVDDAIVEVENIVRHLRNGKPPKQAAEEAVTEIGLAVVATSMTLCAVFLPVAFMPGIPGKFFKQFAVTTHVRRAVLAAGRARPHADDGGVPDEAASAAPRSDGRLKRWYLGKVHWCLAYRRQDAGSRPRCSSSLRSRSYR